MRWLILSSLIISCFVSLAFSPEPTRPIEPMLINGTPIPDGDRPDIVRIQTNNAWCTASLVGKRVLATASHCGKTGATTNFNILGKAYTGKVFRSPLYPGKDHDISLIIATEDIDLGGKPLSQIGGQVATGARLYICGYGCTKPGGGGGNDGVLRCGYTKITGTTGYDKISSDPPNGAVICFGDSGGPSYVEASGHWLQIGVNSKGNIKDTNYTARLDTPESQKFLKDIAEGQKVDICGVTVDCLKQPEPQPQPQDGFCMANEIGELCFKSTGKLAIDYIRRHTEMLMLHLLDTSAMK